MNKFAVILSWPDGSRPDFEALDLSLEEAQRIVRGGGRAECAPIGRAHESWVLPGTEGSARVWSVVASKKNEEPHA